MTAQGAVSASSGIDHVDAGEKRPVKLAMSRQFLAAPAGNADGRELSNEEVLTLPCSSSAEILAHATVAFIIIRVEHAEIMLGSRLHATES